MTRCLLRTRSARHLCLEAFLGGIAIQLFSQARTDCTVTSADFPSHSWLSLGLSTTCGGVGGVIFEQSDLS